MGYGPKLTNITAGGALIADTVMQNFQAIANFLRAIPRQNLLQYSYTASYPATFDGGSLAAITKYWGLQRVNSGSPVANLDLTACINPTAFPLPDTIAVTVEKCSPVGAVPVAADLWVPLGTANFNAGNTIAANNIGTALFPRFADRVALGAVVVNDGDWIRFATGCGALSSFVSGEAQAIFKHELRS